MPTTIHGAGSLTLVLSGTASGSVHISPDLPNNLAECRVHGRYYGTDGEPLEGTVTFTPRPPVLIDDGGGTVLIARPRTADLFNGKFAILLIATDDTDLNPSKWTYLVTENFTGGRTFDMKAPGGQDIDILRAAPVPSSFGIPRYVGPPGAPGGSDPIRLAREPEMLWVGTITYDGDGAPISADVEWPDGDTGTYTADVVSVDFPGSVDEYHITKATHTYTQPLVTRDPATGEITDLPAIVVT